jgi:hypothetical protein
MSSTQTPPTEAQSDPHTPAAIREDQTQYGGYLKTGTCFYDSESQAFYRLDDPHENFSFTLTRCQQVHPTKYTDSVDTEPSQTENRKEHPISTITALAGEIKRGTLIPLPLNEQRTIADTSILNTGQLIYVDPPSNLSDPYPSINPRTAAENERTSPKSHATIKAFSTDPEELHLNPENEARNCAIFAPPELRETITPLIDSLSEPEPDSIPSSIQTRPNSAQGAATDGGGTQTYQELGTHPSISSLPYYPGEDNRVISRFVPTAEHPSDTFSEPNLRNFVEHYLKGRVLNACAGESHLTHDGDIVRNDINPEKPADLHVDVCKLPLHLEENSFDAIVYDPPWSHYESRARYDGYHVHKNLKMPDLHQKKMEIDVRKLPFEVPGEKAVGTSGVGTQSTLEDISANGTIDREPTETDSEEKSQLGHARLAKLGFDYLLKPGGHIIQLAYSGSVMAADLGYQRIARTAFDPHGTARTLIGAVDRAPQNE